jgi:hypothetical protein
MPYITNNQRKRLHEGGVIETAGELNYALTRLVQTYLGDHPTYQLFNDALGALEGCKLELYRRQISKYEDEKIKINGDVYL